MPAAASASTSATIPSNGRLISLPRTDGTMQKAHELSQPIWIVTQAVYGRPRRTGSGGLVVEGLGLVEDLHDRPAPVGRLPQQLDRPAHVVGAEDGVDLGRPLWMRSRSFWARQPPTAICMPG